MIRSLPVLTNGMMVLLVFFRIVGNAQCRADRPCAVFTALLLLLFSHVDLDLFK